MNVLLDTSLLLLLLGVAIDAIFLALLIWWV